MKNPFAKARKPAPETPDFLLPKDCFPILTAEDYLVGKPESQLLEKIYDYSKLPKSSFDHHYLPAIRNLAETVHEAPAGRDHHPYNRGLLHHVLKLTMEALRIRTGRRIPDGVTAEKEMKQRSLWTYAVFAASILRELGPCLGSLRIQLAGPDGKLMTSSEGDRLIGDKPPSSIDGATGIRIRFLQPAPVVPVQVSLLYAERILPPIGYRWLRADPEVFQAFLNVFDSSPTGPVHELVEIGRSDSILEYRNRTLGSIRSASELDGPPQATPDAKTEQEPATPQEESFVPPEEEPDDTANESADTAEETPPKIETETEVTGEGSPPDQEDQTETDSTVEGVAPEKVPDGEQTIAQHFIAWISERLVNREILLNIPEAGACWIREGLFLYTPRKGDSKQSRPDLLERFTDEYTDITDPSLTPEELRDQLLEAGCLKPSPDGRKKAWLARPEPGSKFVNGWLLDRDKLDLSGQPACHPTLKLHDKKSTDWSDLM